MSSDHPLTVGGGDSRVDLLTGSWGGDNNFTQKATPGQWLETGGVNAIQSMTPSSPDPSAPPAPPSAAAVRQGAVNDQISEEQRQYSASTILSGGQGLIDQPTTASRVLLGS